MKRLLDGGMFFLLCGFLLTVGCSAINPRVAKVDGMEERVEFLEKELAAKDRQIEEAESVEERTSAVESRQATEAELRQKAEELTAEKQRLAEETRTNVAVAINTLLALFGLAGVRGAGVARN